MQWTDVFFLLSNHLWIIAAIVLVIGGLVAWAHARADHAHNDRMRADEPDVDEPAVFWLFYADWCGACRSAKPSWKAFRQAYENQVYRGRRIECRETNATDVEMVRDKLTQHSVTAFPTVVLVHRGEERKLRGPITSENLLGLLDKNIDR